MFCFLCGEFKECPYIFNNILPNTVTAIEPICTLCYLQNTQQCVSLVKKI